MLSLLKTKIVVVVLVSEMSLCVENQEIKFVLAVIVKLKEIRSSFPGRL
jgi:hypothetical protein